MDDVVPPQEIESGCITVAEDMAPEPSSPSSSSPSRKTRRQKSSSSASTCSETNTEASVAESDIVRQEDHVASVAASVTTEVVDDLISLPSPVAASTTSVFDAFATAYQTLDMVETLPSSITDDSTIEVVTEVMDTSEVMDPEYSAPSLPKDPVVLETSKAEVSTSMFTTQSMSGANRDSVGTSGLPLAQAILLHQDDEILEVIPPPAVLSATLMKEAAILAGATSSTVVETTDAHDYQKFSSTETLNVLKTTIGAAQTEPSTAEPAEESSEEHNSIRIDEAMNSSVTVSNEPSSSALLGMTIEVVAGRTKLSPPKSIGKTVSPAPSKSPVAPPKCEEKNESNVAVIESTKTRPKQLVRSQSESKGTTSKSNSTALTSKLKPTTKVASMKTLYSEQAKSDATTEASKSRTKPKSAINSSKNGLPLPPPNGTTPFGSPPPAPAKTSMALTASDDSSTTNEPEATLKKRLSSSEIEAAANRLYADANESKKRKDALRAELRETYSFAPQVNPSKRRNSNPGGDPTKSRFDQLHERGKDALRRKETKVTAAGSGKECTFRPAITAKARRLSKAKVNDRPRYENLYRNAQEIKQKREGRRQEAERSAVEECSFKPKIKAVKSPIPSRPLYDAEREKQKKLEREQKKVETELSACTFKPKVTKKAAASVKQSEEQLFDRLYHADQERKERMEKRRQEHDEQEKALTPFQPQLSSSTIAHIKSVEKQAKLQQPFHERLFSKDHLQQVEHEREQRRLEEERRFSFKVRVGDVFDHRLGSF